MAKSARAHKEAKKRPVSKAKAKEILKDGSVRGHALTKKQRGLFGAIAGGSPLNKYQHSPDRFTPDAVKSAEPPRIEYHGQPENLNTAETDKKAGTSRGKIQEGDGTGNLRADAKTKSAAMPTEKAGGSKIPGLVDRYNDSGELP